METEAPIKWEFGEGSFFFKEYIRIGKEMKALLRFLRERSRTVKGKLMRALFSKYRKEGAWGYGRGLVSLRADWQVEGRSKPLS